MRRSRNDEAQGDPGGEHAHEHDHQARRRLFVSDAQQRHARDRGKRQQGLAQVHLVSKYREEINCLERITDEKAGEQGQTCGVCPEYGNIGQTEKPEDQEGAVIAEHVLGVVVNAACARIAACHEEEVPTYDEHEHHADEQAEDAPQRSRLRKISVAGDYQRTPAHAGAYRQRPRRGR